MKFRHISILLGLVVATGAAVFWWPKAGAAASAKPAKTADAKKPAAPPLAVSGVKLAYVPFAETITASGTLRAEESIELQSELNGKVVALNFKEGQPVRQGEVLVKIDDSSQQASLRRAIARRDLALLREQRLARLVAEGGVSQLQVDEAKGDLAVIEAEIDVIRAELAKTEIRAPFDGVAGIRFVSLGAYVNPATRIATLQNLHTLKVDFSIPERYAPFVKPGAPVSFTVAGSPVTYEAVVTAVEPRIEVSTRTVLLRAVCENSGLSLIPGLFARIEFAITQAQDALLVPAIAVVAGLEERFVFVARDDKAVRVRVRTGARTTTRVQILEGLHPGDVVLVSGVQQLRAGLPVKVTLAGS